MNISPHHLEDLFLHHPLSDLLVTGYIDSGSSLPDGIKPPCRFGQFHALWDEVYLEVGRTLLRFRATDSYSRMTMEEVQRIESFFDVDPDDTFGVMSVMRILLPSGRDSAHIERLDVYIHPDSSPETGTIAALGLALDRDEYLFFDPQDAANGIHVGSRQSRDLWLAWTHGRYPLQSRPVSAQSRSS